VIELATGETGFSDVFYDLVSVQYHALKAGHDYGQYVRDAKNGGFDEIANFFEQVMKEDSERAAKCHQFLAQLSGTEHAGPAVS
jgi:ferritin